MRITWNAAWSKPLPFDRAGLRLRRHGGVRVRDEFLDEFRCDGHLHQFCERRSNSVESGKETLRPLCHVRPVFRIRPSNPPGLIGSLPDVAERLSPDQGAVVHQSESDGIGTGRLPRVFKDLFSCETPAPHRLDRGAVRRRPHSLSRISSAVIFPARALSAV